MIGNDIIDLKIALSQKKAGNKRYLDKIYTGSEKHFIKTSLNPELTLWLLWSMKEAVYKAHQRIFKLPRTLNPSKIECTILSSGNEFKYGVGQADGINYYTSSNITSDYIHSVACSTNKQVIFNKILSNKENLKKDFIKEFSRENSLAEDQLYILKDEHSIPFFSIKKTRLQSSFSLSHHGRFGAYIFPLIKY